MIKRYDGRRLGTVDGRLKDRDTYTKDTHGV